MCGSALLTQKGSAESNADDRVFNAAQGLCPSVAYGAFHASGLNDAAANVTAIALPIHEIIEARTPY
jgi:hypothetical protein